MRGAAAGPLETVKDTMLGEACLVQQQQEVEKEQEEGGSVAGRLCVSAELDVRDIVLGWRWMVRLRSCGLVESYSEEGGPQ